MKYFFAAIGICALAIPMGCDRGTSGGPAAKDSPSAPTITRQSEDTFSLGVPSASVNQGESETVTIDISRGRNFGQDVTLTLGELPKGITLSPTNPQIKHGDTDAEFLLTAAPNAALGVFTVEVTGKPNTGASAVAEMKITVSELDRSAATRSTDGTTQEEWNTRTTAMEAEVARLAQEYEMLQERANNATGQAKADLDQQVEQARIRHEQARAELSDRRAAGASGWERITEGVASAFDN